MIGTVTTTRLDAIEVEIKSRLKRTAEDVIRIGELLIEAQQYVTHGGWENYLETLEIPPRMAQHWMNVARRFGGKNEIISLFNVTTLIELSAPSTPYTAIEEVEQRLQANERLTVRGVENIIHQHQAVKALAQATQTIIDTKPDKTSMESHVRSMAVVSQEMAQTGAVDLADGEMAHLGEVVGQAAQVETERRRQEHIAQMTPKRQFETVVWRKQVAVAHIMSLFEQLSPDELVYVTVEVEKQ